MVKTRSQKLLLKLVDSPDFCIKITRLTTTDMKIYNSVRDCRVKISVKGMYINLKSNASNVHMINRIH